MSQPAVQITELDGALGVLPPSAGKLYAVVGPSSGGPLNAPATYARVKDLIATFGVGPLVEAAAHYIERYGRPVLVVRTATTTAGAASAVAEGGTGTSVVTLTGTPTDDAEILFQALTGGTVGTAGITFRWSVDGGRTWSPTTALGTANSFPIPGSGVALAFAAGTVVAGDTASATTTAPAPNATDLGAAFDALAASAASWDLVHVAAPIDGALFDALELRLSALFSSGKERAWIGNARIPTPGETEAAYLTALTAAFGARASVFGDLCAGACKLTSSVTGRKVRRPASFAIAAREASLAEHINSADINLGPLVGVSIRDVNGNPDEHDESVNPGLDDARFTVLRTWEGLGGVYINRPRLFSPAGSDFQLLPHRRVINLAHAALRSYFQRRLNRPVRVSRATGYILEDEAVEIEAGARAVLRAVLLAAPKASDILFTLSRTDNLLSTRTLTGDARVIPLGYPEWVNLSIGFYNPALALQAA